MKQHVIVKMGCGDCPFSGFDEDLEGEYRACFSPYFLDPNDAPQVGRAFNESPIDIFPDPPPDWCPLRGGVIVISLAGVK